ncbi:hypothetical protein OG203_44730 [Nocardia sp. NBC_01499]|uniref:hypothetical protein n=1 Tax=Nocardia sp. NBC_01499 TaxID=2903597 RepID=UPI00386AC3EF
MTTYTSGRLRRLGLGAAAAAAAMVLAAPIAAADPPVGHDAPLTVSSDHGQWSVGSTYALTVTATPPVEGTVRFCISGNGYTTCYNPIPTQNGIATMQWTPTRQGAYEINSDYTMKTESGGKLVLGASHPTILVYCPGHQGSSWDC